MLQPDDIGISKTNYDTIISILSTVIEITEVKIFGSRAKGNYKSNSDIDLALIGDNISVQTIVKLSALFADSTIPYKVDLVHYNSNISYKLKEHIDRVGILFWKNEL